MDSTTSGRSEAGGRRVVPRHTGSALFAKRAESSGRTVREATIGGKEARLGTKKEKRLLRLIAAARVGGFIK